MPDPEHTLPTGVYDAAEAPKVFWPRYVKVAIDYFDGSVDRLAAALRCTPAAVYQWSTVPKGRAYQLEVITGGGLKAYLLNPSCDRAPDAPGLPMMAEGSRG